MILSRGYKLRYVNQLVGLFVILVSGLVFAALLVVAWGQEWFVGSYEIRAYLPEGELDGLQVNSPIQILGERVGKVREISYVDDEQKLLRLRRELPGGRLELNYLEVTLQISNRVSEEVDADSRIQIRRRMAGVGDVYLEILRGARRLGSPDEQTLFAITPEKSAQDEIRTMTQLMSSVQEDFARMRQTLDESSISFDRSTAELAKASTRVRELAESMLEVTPRLPEIADDVQRTTRDLQTSSEQIRSTAEAIGQSNRQLQNVLSDAEAVSPRLLPIARQTERLLSTSQVVADRLRDESDTLPGTVGQFRETVGDAQEVIDGLRQNWLIRRHVEQPQTPGRLPASKFRTGGFSP